MKKMLFSFWTIAIIAIIESMIIGSWWSTRNPTLIPIGIGIGLVLIVAAIIMFKFVKSVKK